MVTRVFNWRLLLWASLVLPAAPAAAQLNIAGPQGSESFGGRLLRLPNGNLVVVDPLYDAPGPLVDVGAVHVLSPDGLLLSTLSGSTPGDQVGSGGATLLTNGNVVVSSPLWDGAAVDTGAVTWIDGESGLQGVVSAANSLVGGNPDDRIGNGGVEPLANGHYVAVSFHWNSGSIMDAGAVTWGNGATGVRGKVSASNSLVGRTENDVVGISGVTVLSNGHYVVGSPAWDDGPLRDVGAVTWGNGDTGIQGEITPENSLVGSAEFDQLGVSLASNVPGIVELSTGHFVVASPDWDFGSITDAGAATWINGWTGLSGRINDHNSLVGSRSSDRVSGFGITPLTTGHYVVISPFWDRVDVPNAGAVTWGHGEQGVVGKISEVNSLVGSFPADRIGIFGVQALATGHYVVNSPVWHELALGAVTWGDGNLGTTGAISEANSLIGANPLDFIGSGGVTVLTNGHYVVASQFWDFQQIPNVGAVTWGDGEGGTTGPVSDANSLFGGSEEDQIGTSEIDGVAAVTALANGHYVVVSDRWNNGAIEDAGAVTWCDGSTLTRDQVSPANSLVGEQPFDRVGNFGVAALTNGHFVALSPDWDDGSLADVGAATWGDGSQGLAGSVSPINSLIGTAPFDQLGSAGALALSNGNYVVLSPNWDDGPGQENIGAATWAEGTSGIVGEITSANSLVGANLMDQVGLLGASALPDGGYVVRSPRVDDVGVGDGGAISLGQGNGATVGPIAPGNSVIGHSPGNGMSLQFAYDENLGRLIVGRPAENLVTLFPSPDPLFADSFE